MKTTFLIIALLGAFVSTAFTQNLLSPVWRINFGKFSENIDKINTDNWKDVNLLLSWERQGFSGEDGSGCIVNEFAIPNNLSASELTLSIGLQCDIEKIYINGKLIGGNLPNQFWSNRGAKTDFDIPQNCLHKGKPNQIAILISNLSYTGGISVNSFSISPKETTLNSRVKIEIPAKDHLYDVNNENSFSINYNAANEGIIKLSVVNDFHEAIVQNQYKVKKGKGTIHFNFKGSITTPGFYECIAVMNDGGYSSDVQWLTLSPEKIECTNNTTPRFQQYWDEAMAELKKVQPAFKITKVDSLCTATRDGYIAEMKSLDNLTIRGYYFVPKTDGKHAAILHVPGYGDGYQHLGKFMQNQENVIEFALCVRGHGISADVFNPGFGMPGIWGYKLCSDKENAYRGIYMDCVRAVELLLSRPEVDTARIGVMGGSQGGGLTLAVAALCRNNIKACAFFDPFPCDTRHHLKIRTMCTQQIKGFVQYYNNECSFEDALKVQDLIDSKGFASWIKCPSFFVTSLFDDDAPSHMGFSAYNSIQAPKQFKIYPELGHMNDKAHGVQMEFMKRELGY